MKYLAVGCVSLCCAIYPAAAPAQANLLSPFAGVWSDSAHGCRLLAEGKLDDMSTAQASRLGIIKISRKGIDWPYNSGTTQCVFAAGKAKATAQGVGGPAECDYKGQAMKEYISLARAASKLNLRFAKGFYRDGEKVKCR